MTAVTVRINDEANTANVIRYIARENFEINSENWFVDAIEIKKFVFLYLLKSYTYDFNIPLTSK